MQVRLSLHLNAAQVAWLKAEAARRSGDKHWGNVRWTWKEVAAIQSQLALVEWMKRTGAEEPVNTATPEPT